MAQKLACVGIVCSKTNKKGAFNFCKISFKLLYEEMLREVYGKDGRQAGMPSNNLMPAKI